MKRILVKLSMWVPDEMTVGGVVEKIGMTPSNDRVHVDYNRVSVSDINNRVVKSSNLIAYAVELK